MKQDFPTPNSALPRRRFLQVTALGALALVGGDWTRRALGADGGLAADVAMAPHAIGLLTPVVQARAPLAPSPFAALPLGSVQARGWLLHQLKLQRDGLTGQAEEVLPATAPNSAWKGGDGEDWEKGPYYLKGLVALAYTLDDATLKAKMMAWIEPILASGTPEGSFGPKKNNDWWPRMVATYLLRDYAEASGDTRVEPLLTNYYRFMSQNLPTRPLKEWGRARAGDEIDTVLWLYNRTGDEFLLPLADLLAEQAYPWRQIFTENRFLEYGDDFYPKHAVNVPQALKMPVVYSQRSGKAEDKAAYRAGISHLMQDHGTSFGINTGTEMLSGRSAAEGVELCSIVEHMLSAETAMRILGDATIGDEIELIAFNSLPAALSKDIHQHVYYTLSNNVTAPRGGLGYEEDYGDGRTPAPRSGFPCCCYNFHMGWPKLAQNAWAATANGGVAALVYVPSQVKALVSGGATATVTAETNYPFEDTIYLTVNLTKPSRFPLQLRIPNWCRNAQIKVNGAAQPKAAAGGFAIVTRDWKDGDRVELTFPMTVEAVKGINDSVSIRRGPLVYSLKMDENWTPFEHNNVPGFDSYEVTSETPWNYALVLDPQNPANSIKVVNKAGTQNPFETGNAPISLQVQGKRLEDWKLRFDNHIALDPPLSPVAPKSATETLELVPFGSQMLRVVDFPVVGTPSPRLTKWSEDFSGDYSQRWVVQRGSHVRDGQLQLPRIAKGIAATAVFADCTYEADVTVGDHGNAGLLLRASDVSIGTDHYKGYYVGLEAENNLVVLGKSNNVWTEISRKPKTIEAGKVHRVRVEMKGPQIRVWVNDMTNPALEATDADFTSGALGVRSYSNQAAFGKLTATAI